MNTQQQAAHQAQERFTAAMNALNAIQRGVTTSQITQGLREWSKTNPSDAELLQVLETLQVQVKHSKSISASVSRLASSALVDLACDIETLLTDEATEGSPYPNHADLGFDSPTIGAADQPNFGR
jgi:hypothetical protein